MRTHKAGLTVHVFFKQDEMNLVQEYESEEEGLDFVQSSDEDPIEVQGMRLKGGTWLSPAILAELVSMDDRHRAGSLRVLVEADEMQTRVADTLIKEYDIPHQQFESTINFALVAGADIIDRAMNIAEHVKASLYGCRLELGMDCWEEVYTNRGALLFEMVLLVSCIAAFWLVLMGQKRG